jgi:hypothetical protein
MDPVAICNLALGFIGANKIRSIEAEEADSVEAELCAALFWPTAHAVLEAADWLFATGFIDLGAKTAAPANEVDRVDLPARFTMPADAIAVRRCDDGSGDFTIKWERNGRFVMSEGTDALYAIVTWDKEPGDWTPTFCLAVAHLLASQLAGPLTQKQSIIDREYALFEREKKSAKTFDGMQGNTVQKVQIKTSSLANRR